MNNYFFAETNRRPPLILGHRGAMDFAPENTLAAFHLALEQGAGGFEFDIQLSKDGVPVVIHDSTLDRTTNGSGRVEQYTVAELQAFDAGDGEKIPTLEELFVEFGERVLYNIEIKHFTLQPGQVEAAVAALVEKYDLAQSCLVSSFRYLIMHRYRRVRHPDTAQAMIRVAGPQGLSRYLFKGEADHPHYSMVNASYMSWAEELGIQVNVWTVNEQAEAERLLKLGVDALITNRPGEIAEVVTL